MATATNPPPGAVLVNGSADLFTTSPSHSHPAPLRYAAFDNDQFSLYSTNSPSSARRALEAHLKDTDRRIHDASRLGSTLIQQRKDLAARLTEIEQIQQESEVPVDLQQKLSELEREYNEVGRESARALLPRSRVVSENGPDSNVAASAVISGSGRESPTKLAAPSRRQRNHPSNRVHDIEFATEISTSLLAQVRQLQAALAEKDAELKDTVAAQAHLESEAAILVQKIRHMDENEQKYKDENWNLETRLQEIEASLKLSLDKGDRLTQTLKSTQFEVAAKERELDELKATHDKLHDDHAMAKKVQEADLHGLRRDAAFHESEKQRLHRKVDELNAQNTELAKAVSYRLSLASQPSDTDFVSAEEGAQSDDQSPNNSEPSSPIKGTPARHSLLETETLKSSLNHAHRMIQNLKNTVHREKTEKIELKRMLQDARDELETRRENGNTAANVAKKRRAEPEGVKFKRPVNTGRLGAARSGTTEILDDEPDWEEDHDIDQTPSKSRSTPMATGYGVNDVVAGYNFDNALSRSEEDSTDAFETANERDTTTESEAFATGNEDFDHEDTEGDLTETEGNSMRNIRPVNRVSSKPGDRISYMSTASTSGEEDEDIIKTPVQSTQQPKYKLRLSRGARRSGRAGDVAAELPNTTRDHSPSSSFGTPQPNKVQSLGDELDALDESSMEGTPASSRMRDLENTPDTQRYASVEPATPDPVANNVSGEGLHAIDTTSSLLSSHGTRQISNDAISASQAHSVVLAHELNLSKPEMVDSGVMTEPWEPERIVEERVVEKIVVVPAESESKPSLRDRAGELVGGALAGFGLSRVVGRTFDDPNIDGEHNQSRQDAAAEVPADGVDQPSKPDFSNTASTQPININTDVDLDSNTVNTGADAPAISIAVPAGMSEITSPLTQSDKTSEDVTSAEPNLAGPRPAIAQPEPVHFSFSDVVSQELEPVATEQMVHDVEEEPKSLDNAQVREDFATGADTGTLVRRRSKSLPTSERSVRFAEDPRTTEDRETIESRVFSEQTADQRGDSDLGDGIDTADPRIQRTISVETSTKASQDRFLTDEGSQTIVSGDDIDGMLRNKFAATIPALSVKDTGSSPIRGAAYSGATSLSPKDERRYGDVRTVSYDPPTLKPLRRPGSSGSMRSKALLGAPPLPSDHTRKIAAAQQTPDTTTGKSSSGTMGPPAMPASAYKPKSKVPGERAVSRDSHSRESNTQRPTRMKESKGQMTADRMSHRTSVSSFASELDERFNITRGQIMYPNDIAPATDPRMIQAITQTMIGEYLWKYTRKAGRSETSSTRHRRFFWVHPYTRTLYWSEHDPSTAGKNMLKAKSVAIDAVRVVSDDNAYPPGLHRKSLVVITPGRDIVFTAPTGQRHETWFNALSYLLLRADHERSEAEDVIENDDMDDSNSGFASRTVRRSFSRFTGTSRARSHSRHSRASLSSYNSRTTRTTSPQRHDPDHASAGQYDTGTVRQKSLQPPPQDDGHRNGLSTNSRAASGSSMAGRISSLTSRFVRPSSSHRDRSSAFTHAPEDPAQIYDASIVADSAEDLRAVIERQERDADRLENVRACCDGKHDVGSLSRSHKHSSFGSRFGSHGHHSHSHAHPTR